ncbi:hypothetical protein LZ30DRAFT_737946 [Colletotrichum cereale]|nr:hypothetical protein LZ30DRAFT_737946 [Colletotrichum cereale]
MRNHIVGLLLSLSLSPLLTSPLPSPSIGLELVAYKGLAGGWGGKKTTAHAAILFFYCRLVRVRSARPYARRHNRAVFSPSTHLDWHCLFMRCGSRRKLHNNPPPASTPNPGAAYENRYLHSSHYGYGYVCT